MLNAESALLLAFGIWHFSYSCLSACIGSTVAARRAGTYAATSAIAIIAAAAKAIGHGLASGRGSITLDAKRLLHSATGAPTINPTHTTANALFSTITATSV